MRASGNQGAGAAQGAGAEQHVAIFGLQVQVGAGEMGMNEHMSEAQALARVKQAGVVDPTQANEMAELLIAAGLTMPSAWAQIEKRELVELGVPLGYTAALIAEAQRFMAGRCGAQFVRVMEGSVRSETCSC